MFSCSLNNLEILMLLRWSTLMVLLTHPRIVVLPCFSFMGVFPATNPSHAYSSPQANNPAINPLPTAGLKAPLAAPELPAGAAEPDGVGDEELASTFSIAMPPTPVPFLH